MKLTEAQRDARLAILRDVERSGGIDRWSHLHSHGHHYQQVRACVYRGDLAEPAPYNYRLTEAGLSTLESRRAK